MRAAILSSENGNDVEVHWNERDGESVNVLGSDRASAHVLHGDDHDCVHGCDCDCDCVRHHAHDGGGGGPAIDAPCDIDL